MGKWQNWLSRWARWWNITDQNQPNPAIRPDGPPCTCVYIHLQARLSACRIYMLIGVLWGECTRTVHVESVSFMCYELMILITDFKASYWSEKQILLRLDFAFKIFISEPILKLWVPYESPDSPLSNEVQCTVAYSPSGSNTHLHVTRIVADKKQLTKPTVQFNLSYISYICLYFRFSARFSAIMIRTQGRHMKFRSMSARWSIMIGPGWALLLHHHSRLSSTLSFKPGQMSTQL